MLDSIYSAINALSVLAPFSIPLAVILGLLIGSFLNVVIYRTPIMMEREWTQFSKEHLGIELTDEEKQPFNLRKPDSRCPECKSPIRFWQNIPILSYVFLGGKCHSCKTAIGIRYPLIELLTGVLFGIVAWQYGWSWATIGGFILTAILIALTFIDADTQYLPDSLTQPLIWIGLLFNLNDTFVPLHSAVLGAIAGYMSLYTLCAVYKLLTGKIGMGNGDFKLLAALGAWLGVGILPVLIFMAALVGLVGALVARTIRIPIMTLWIGLTGGIGSGKSSIAQMFAELGVPIIDADAISRSLTAENGEALPAIRQLFGDEVFDSEGRLNRMTLREEVFRRPQSKKQLENLLLPLILNKIQLQKQQLTSSAYGIVDVPLLVENPAFKAETDRILVVDVPESVQIKRVHQRNGFSEEQTRQIMATQASRSDRLLHADDVLDNTHSLEEAKIKVARLHQYYQSIAQSLKETA